MQINRRCKDWNWFVADEDGFLPSWDRPIVAVLMDLRDELKTLNNLLHCDNFVGIPVTLRSIQRNTARKPRKPIKRAR